MSGKLRTSPADNGRMMANPSGCMQCEVLDQCLLLAHEDVSRQKPGKTLCHRRRVGRSVSSRNSKPPECLKQKRLLLFKWHWAPPAVLVI